MVVEELIPKPLSAISARVVRVGTLVCVSTALVLRFVQPCAADEVTVTTAVDRRLLAELENEEMLAVNGWGPVVALVQPTSLARDVRVGTTGGLNDAHFAAIARVLRDSGVASIRADLRDGADVSALLAEAHARAKDSRCVLAVGYRDGADLLSRAVEDGSPLPAAVLVIGASKADQRVPIVRRVSAAPVNRPIGDLLLEEIAYEIRDMLYATKCYLPPTPPASQ
jgi:hypothetical protein